MATATVSSPSSSLPSSAASLELLAKFLHGAGAEIPEAQKRAMAIAAVRSTTRVYVLEPGSKESPTVAIDGVTKNYSGMRMVAIAFGKGSDASGKTVMCRPGKMRELLAHSAELLAACTECEKRDAKDNA
jgi:hypothetical protein